MIRAMVILVNPDMNYFSYIKVIGNISENDLVSSGNYRCKSLEICMLNTSSVPWD